MKALRNLVLGFLFRSFEAGASLAEGLRRIREQHPRKPIVLALSHAGWLDFIALRYAIERHFEAPFRIEVATQMPWLYVYGFRGVWRKLLQPFLGKTEPRVVQLGRSLSHTGIGALGLSYWRARSKLFRPPGEIDIEYLQSEFPDALIVPVAIVWKRTTGMERGSLALTWYGRLSSYLLFPLLWVWKFSLGDSLKPTELRKLIVLIRGYSRSAIKVLDPIEVLSQDSKSLRRCALQAVAHERRNILGPTFYSTEHIGDLMLREPSFHEFLDELSKKTLKPREALLEKSHQYFKEIAADFNFRYMELIDWAMDRVLRSLYRKIDIRDADVERLRQLGTKGTIVFVPNHVSYMDFLILSYVLFQKEFCPPHVASGINLNFWPAGHIFRSSGAFFIRRSFKDNPLYKEVLKRYMATLLNQHFSIQYFVEGTRSRTGKLAPPKYGMLTMLMDAFQEGLIHENVFIVPVSISYDKLTEDRAYEIELSGGEKPKENFINSLRSLRVIFRRYGNVYLRFGNPLRLADWAPAKTAATLPTPTPDVVSATNKKAVYRCTFEVCDAINSVRPVTGLSLVATALMAAPKGRLLKYELDVVLGELEEFLQKNHAYLQEDLVENFQKACRRGLADLLENGIVIKSYTQQGLLFEIPSQKRLLALNRKNGAIHALTLAGMKTLSGGDLDRALQLRQLMQFEFFFSNKEQFSASIDALPSHQDLSLFSFVMHPYFETLSFCLSIVEQLQSQYLSEKEWLARLTREAQNTIRAGHPWPESFNTQSLKAFVDLAINQGWIIPSAPGGLYRANAPALAAAKAIVHRTLTPILSWDEWIEAAIDRNEDFKKKIQLRAEHRSTIDRKTLKFL